MWAIAGLALAALIIDVVLHVAALVGLNPQDWIRPDWAARVVCFGLFLIVLLAANMAAVRRDERAKRLGIILSDQNPRWFAWLMKIAIVYGLFSAINFGVIDFRRAGGAPVRQADGAHVADPGHGHPVRPITAAEYDRFRRRSVRGVTGFFLMFYLQVAFDMVWFMRHPLRADVLRVVRVELL
jgi:hypothetical protein